MHIGLTADSVADLLGHVSDLVNWIRQEVVWFQEVKCAERQQLKGDAHMAVVVKPVEHLHAVTDEEEKQRVKHKAHETGNSVSITDSLFVVRILLTDLLQDVDFQFGCFFVFVLVLNDLQCNLISSSVFKHCFKKKKKNTPTPPPPHTLHIDSTWNFWWKTYLLWSTHWTTFPKVPSPKVSTISSARQIKISLMTEHRNEAAYSSYICAATYICLQGRHHFCRSGDHFQSPSHCHLQPGRFFSANKVSHIHDKVEQKIKKTSTCFCHTPPKNTPSNIWPLGL